MAKQRYVVELKHSARKGLEKLPSVVLARIITVLERLQAEPRPACCKKLKSGDAEYRVRVGDSRIVQLIDDERILVTVVRVRRGRQAYERKTLCIPVAL